LDTDTNGAIAMGLFGAYYGYDKLYEQQTVNMEVLFNCTTENGNKMRPKKYRTSAITDLFT
jgi:ADP-ribosylglycohydrolase